MSWNDGIERKRFEARMKKQREEYITLGLSLEQIKEIEEFDLKEYRSNRRYRMHTQELSTSSFYDSDDEDDSKSALLHKFFSVLTVDIDSYEGKSRYWWVEEIDNTELVKRIKLLAEKDLELLTKYVFDGYTQRELAGIYGVSLWCIHTKIADMKTVLFVQPYEN